MSLTIAAIPKEQLNKVWYKCEPLILMAASKAPDDINLDRIKSEIEAKRTILITISNETDIIALHTLDVRTLDSGIKALYIPITAGTRMSEWIDEFLVIVENLALDLDCGLIRGGSPRQGWLRKLKPYGWNPVYTIFEKRVGE